MLESTGWFLERLVGINATLEEMDLAVAHDIVAVAGVLMSVYVAQLWSTNQVADEHWTIAHIRRIGLGMFGGGMAWSVWFGHDKGWQPWPAHLLAIIGTDAILAATILAVVVQRLKKKQRIDADAG